MRITPQGTLPIPPEVQERLGLVPDTEVELAIEGDSLRITKSTTKVETRGSAVIRRLRGRAAPSSSTDEIMAMTRGDE